MYKVLFENHKKIRLYFVIFIYTVVFIITGMLQMIVGRLIGVHNGLEHMMFNHWWQYVCEGLFYSLCHAGIYHWFKNND